MERRVARKILLGTLVFFLSIWNLSGVCFANNDSPLEQVRFSVENVISILQDKNLQEEHKKATKRGLIMEEVEKRFNFHLMAKLSLGKVWVGLSEKQQDEFEWLFSDLLKNTYINRVEGYSDEKVVYGKELIKNDLAQVSSIFEKNNSQLSIIYKMRRENGLQWLVYDVVIEGASLIKQYRRQFAQIIDKEEFKGLIIRLEDKMKAINKKS